MNLNFQASHKYPPKKMHHISQIDLKFYLFIYYIKTKQALFLLKKKIIISHMIYIASRAY